MRGAKISLAEARRLALHGQLLDGLESLPEGKEGVAEAIERLGYVQIDTIAAVARAHHHTLWTRRPDYTTAMLHDLQAADRRVFEYWAHAMAYVPMSDYRYYVPQMNRIRAEGPPWMREWRAKHSDVIEAVHARIRSEGSLASKDFEPPPGTKRGTWWDWKPAKRALELLFWQGDLMIAERRNFQKVYDLTERILPLDVDRSPPSDEACGRFQVRRALRSLGVARDREVLEFVKVAAKPIVREALDGLVEDGEVVPVEIEGRTDRAYYALAERLETTFDRPIPPHVHILSPFDGLIIQRPRIEWLFDFEYTIECYVPEAKRKYGYFVLPILYGDRLVARLDAKADRKAERLIVRKIWIEPWFEPPEEFLIRLGDALARFALFNQCTSISVERMSPPKGKSVITRQARAALAAGGGEST